MNHAKLLKGYIVTFALRCVSVGRTNLHWRVLFSFRYLHLARIFVMKPILDHTKLQGLEAIIGKEKCEAALGRFQEELRSCLTAIEAGRPERAESAHRLAGVAGLLGFDDLEERSRHFLAAVHQKTDNIASSTEALVKAAHRAEEVLAARG